MWELVTTALVTIQVIVAAAELVDKLLHRRRSAHAPSDEAKR
jgi:hypothetical protein